MHQPAAQSVSGLNVPQRTPRRTTPWVAAVTVLVGTAGLGLHLVSVLTDQKAASGLVTVAKQSPDGSITPGLWDHLRMDTPQAGTLGAVVAAGLVVLWVLLSMYAARRRGISIIRSLGETSRAWLWLWLFGAFEIVYAYALSHAGALSDDELGVVVSYLTNAIRFVHTLALGGWLATLWHAMSPQHGDPTAWQRAIGSRWTLWGGVVLYALVFSTMSTLQWRALVVPHGDTAMYEEHLWNLLHGKGFRSQLDGGRLFLGEHIQLIHVLLVPLYLIYPHLPTLNVAQSIALALGALPVAWLAYRRTGDKLTANLLGLAYLLYFPMQTLNLEASYKTFRPITFCVPLLLYAFWAFETGRYKTTLVLLGLMLVCKEELALVVIAFGVYAALHRRRGPWGRREIALGLALVLTGVAWFLAALLWVIPYFRAGADPHFAGYYGELGGSMPQILLRVVTDPIHALSLVWQYNKVMFVLTMFMPLAFVSVLGPSRWLLALPAFAYCLLSSNPQMQSPLFHFHAPIVPLVVLAAVVGVGHIGGGLIRRRTSDAKRQDWARWGARLVFWAALVSGVWNSKSPLSVTFYDPAMETDGYWGALYVPSERVGAFWKVYDRVPRDASVASTDWIRPRFTHHRVCHDLPLRAHVRLDEIDYFVYDMKDPWWEDKIVGDPWGTTRMPGEPLVRFRGRGGRGVPLFDRRIRLLRDASAHGYPTDALGRLLEFHPDYEPVHLGPFFWILKRRDLGAR